MNLILYANIISNVMHVVVYYPFNMYVVSVISFMLNSK